MRRGDADRGIGEQPADSRLRDHRRAWQSVRAVPHGWPAASPASVKHGSGWPIFPTFVDKGADAPVGMVGAPLDAGSVTPGRCDLAPGLLRATLRRIGRYDVETARELATQIADHGDVPIAGLSIEESTPAMVAACTASVERHQLTLLVGGNNAVTRPGFHAVGEGLNLAYEMIGLVTLDAHFDMRDTSQGLGNGNPVRALLEDGLPGRNVAQIGLAPFANSAEMHRDAIEGHHCRDHRQCRRWHRSGGRPCARSLRHCEASVVDCILTDRPLQLPGAPGARPGGMAAHDFFIAVRSLAAEPRVRLIDLTEWDPPLDSTDLSALTAGRWVAECLAGFEQR